MSKAATATVTTTATKTTTTQQEEKEEGCRRAIEFFLDCKDNGLLHKLCDYLDPLSIYSWGRLVSLWSSSSVNTANAARKANQEALLNVIGTALLDRTWLSSSSLLRDDDDDDVGVSSYCGVFNTKDLFQEDPGTTLCSEEKEEQQDREETSDAAVEWMRKRELLCNCTFVDVHAGSERDALLDPLLNACFDHEDEFKDLKKNDNKGEIMACLCRFLAMTSTAAWKSSQFQFQVPGFEESLALVVLEAVVEGLCRMNIKFSRQMLEASYTLNLITEATHSEYTKKIMPRTAVVGTLAELAWFPGTILEHKPLEPADSSRRYCDFHPRLRDMFDMDERLSHKQQLSQVGHSIELLLQKSTRVEPELEDFKEDILEDLKSMLRLQNRKESGSMNLGSDEDMTWDQLVKELKVTDTVIDEMVRSKQAARRRDLELFAQSTLPALTPAASTSSSFQGDPTKFAMAVQKFWTHWNPFTKSALKLLQFIVEEFALGTVVPPFLLKHPKLPTTAAFVRCHLLLGKRGTTMIAFDKQLEDGTWRRLEVIDHEAIGRLKGYGRKRLGPVVGGERRDQKL